VSGPVPHTFANPSGDRVRFLSICSPGGFEYFFRAVAAGDGEAIAAISERFGYEAVEHGQRDQLRPALQAETQRAGWHHRPQHPMSEPESECTRPTSI
jgi:hypothetical protein